MRCSNTMWVRADEIYCEVAMKKAVGEEVMEREEPKLSLLDQSRLD